MPWECKTQRKPMSNFIEWIGFGPRKHFKPYSPEFNKVPECKLVPNPIRQGIDKNSDEILELKKKVRKLKKKLKKLKR